MLDNIFNINGKEAVGQLAPDFINTPNLTTSITTSNSQLEDRYIKSRRLASSNLLSQLATQTTLTGAFHENYNVKLYMVHKVSTAQQYKPWLSRIIIVPIGPHTGKNCRQSQNILEMS